MTRTNREEYTIFKEKQFYEKRTFAMKNAAYSRALGRREGGRGAVEAAALAELRRRREEQLRAGGPPEERAEERDLGSGASDLFCFTNNKVYFSV